MSITENFTADKPYRIVNNFEHIIKNYKNNLLNYSSSYLNMSSKEPKILSRAFFKLWEILLYFDLALEKNMIDKAIIDKEQELVTEELKNSGKPDDIAKKISLGKMNKFMEENSLLTQAWVMEPKKKVQDVLKELAISDLKIKEFSRIKIGE